MKCMLMSHNCQTSSSFLLMIEIIDFAKMNIHTQVVVATGCSFELCP